MSGTVRDTRHHKLVTSCHKFVYLLMSHNQQIQLCPIRKFLFNESDAASCIGLAVVQTGILAAASCSLSLVSLLGRSAGLQLVLNKG